MRTILITIFLAASWASFSQSTLIEYNYQTETYKFFKITRKGDTVQIKKPYAIKGIPSKVIVKDLNIVDLLNIDRMAQRIRLFLLGEYHRAEKATCMDGH